MNTTIPPKLGELLRQSYQVDPDSTSLLRRLAAAIEEHFDEEDEEIEVAILPEATGKNGSDGQFEEGWRQGLNDALSLIQMAEAEVHDRPQEDETDCERGAKVALACVGRWVEVAMQEGFTDYDEPNDLGLKKNLDKASITRSTQTPAAKMLKPRTKAQAPAQADAGKPPMSVAPSGGGKHQRIAQAFLQAAGGTATRKATREHLMQRGASKTVAYGVLSRMILSDLIQVLDGDLIYLRTA